MRILVLLALLLAACGSTLSPGVARPSPSSKPVPWLAAPAHPTPIPDPTVPPQPGGVRVCKSTELVGGAGRGQGAGGWWTRTIVIADFSESKCLVAGPTAVEYLDATGATIVAADSFTAPSWGTPGWAIIEPAREVTLIGPVSGEALVMLQTYGDCGHALLRAVRITFAGPTGTIVVPVESQPVGGRCDSPTQRLGLSGMPIRPSELPPYPTPPPLPLTFAIDAPSVAFAGEPLPYVVRVSNAMPSPYAWGQGCPIYLEWLGGRDVSPTNVPGHIVKPLDPVYAGTAKEFHSLNCGTAGAVPARGELRFDMRMDLPRDALGPEKVCWAMLQPPETTQVCATIEFLPPRQ